MVMAYQETSGREARGGGEPRADKLLADAASGKLRAVYSAVIGIGEVDLAIELLGHPKSPTAIRSCIRRRYTGIPLA
jgi:hypothetical protein